MCLSACVSILVLFANATLSPESDSIVENVRSRRCVIALDILVMTRKISNNNNVNAFYSWLCSGAVKHNGLGPVIYEVISKSDRIPANSLLSLLETYCMNSSAMSVLYQHRVRWWNNPIIVEKCINSIIKEHRTLLRQDVNKLSTDEVSSLLEVILLRAYCGDQFIHSYAPFLLHDKRRLKNHHDDATGVLRLATPSRVCDHLFMAMCRADQVNIEKMSKNYGYPFSEPNDKLDYVSDATYDKMIKEYDSIKVRFAEVVIKK